MFRFSSLGHYHAVEEEAADFAGWSVTGVQTLLTAVYWTEPIDDTWSWCVECERLVETASLVEHIACTHAGA